jgi:hypothetical protein
VLGCVFDGINDSTDYVLQYLLAPEAYVRFQCKLGEASECMDDVSRRNIIALKKIGEDLVNERRHDISRLVTRLLKPKQRRERRGAGREFSLSIPSL